MENDQINPKFIRGIKGWLVVFLISLIIIGINLTRIVFEELSDPRRNFFILRVEMQMINLLLMIGGVFFPFFVTYQLYKKKAQALLIAKIFLFLFPFYVFTYTIFKSSLPFDIQYAIISGLFVGGCLYSIPWLFYLNYSKRVNNTYLFTGKYLPHILQCPFCLDKLELDKEEQLAEELVCPSCNRIISAKSL